MTHRGPFPPLPFCDSVMTGTVYEGAGDMFVYVASLWT